MDDATSDEMARRSTELYEARERRRWQPSAADEAQIDGFPEWLDHGRYRLGSLNPDAPWRRLRLDGGAG